MGADGDTQAGVGSELGSGGTDTDSDKVGGGSGPAEQPAGGGGWAAVVSGLSETAVLKGWEECARPLNETGRQRAQAPCPAQSPAPSRPLIKVSSLLSLSRVERDGFGAAASQRSSFSQDSRDACPGAGVQRWPRRPAPRQVEPHGL